MNPKKPIVCFILILFVLLLCSGSLNVHASETRIKGRIVGYLWDALWLVQTTKKEYIVLRRNQSFPSNPVPEAILRDKRIWNFAVRPAQNCEVRMSHFRWPGIEPSCGNDFPLATNEPKTPTVFAPYPQLSYFDASYKTQLDAISDEVVLRCFTVDLEKTKPGYNEWFVTGVVLGDGEKPVASFPVSIGYAKANSRLLYVMTDENGRFSIPIWKQLAYWIRPGDTQIEGQRRYKPIQIPRNSLSTALQLRLEYEDSTN